MNPHSKVYSRTWRPVSPPPSRGSRFDHRLRVMAVAAALFAVSGALIAWLFYYQPFPPAYFVPLCMSEYDDEYPVRGWVRQDGEALRSLGWKETNAFTRQQRELLRAELRRLAGRTFKGPLVVYVNAYARTTPEGELCLLPVDARLDYPATWLPLREVFKLLHESKARHTLLLLDIMQPFTDARRGLLVNDASQRVQPLLEEAVANDPGLSVLCACSPGQVSIVAEELGHSVFAYFVWMGLRGQADGENARCRRDNRVCLQELAGYVTAQVDQWTQRRRGVRQSPRLYGCMDDYPLMAVGSGTCPEEEPPLPVEYPDWLKAGWKQRDKWLDEENTRLLGALTQPRSPLLALRADWESALLRAEQQWRGGFPAQDVRRKLVERREPLEHQRDRLPIVAAAISDGPKLPKRADAETIAVEEAQRWGAEMPVQLASYLPYLEVDAAAAPAWEKAIATADKLRQMLAEMEGPPGEARGAKIRRLRELTDVLRNDPDNLNSLRRPLDRPHFDRLIGRRQGANPADGKIMTALLETPWPRAEQRAKLWSARHELLGDSQARQAETSGAWNESQAIEAELRRGLRRARYSLAVLRLLGRDKIEKVETALAAAEAMPTDARRLRTVAEALRQAWTHP